MEKETNDSAQGNSKPPVYAPIIANAHKKAKVKKARYAIGAPILSAAKDVFVSFLLLLHHINDLPNRKEARMLADAVANGPKPAKANTKVEQTATCETFASTI